MRQSNIAKALCLLGVLASTAKLTRAAQEEVRVEEDGITFRVGRFDDGRTNLYALDFWVSGLKMSRYRFNVNGRVGYIRATAERYVVRYYGNGSLREVDRKDTGGRMLLADENAEEAQLELEDLNEENDVLFDHRRLYACEDCVSAWDAICTGGVSSICNLLGNDALGTAADTSIEIVCETFVNVCARLSAEEGCDGQCTPPVIEDECNPNPCLNGGSCELDDAGGYVCSCASDYGGVACATDTSSLAPFYIEVQFAGSWTVEQQQVFQSAANRWSEVVTHVPCGGAIDYPAGRLLITATAAAIDGEYGVLGSAGPTSIWRPCPTISATGDMTFDIADLSRLEVAGTFEGVIVHEMGHVIGVGTLWGDCSTCPLDNDSNWKCPATIAVYNDLLGDPDGTDADIIETDGGAGTACGHFDEITFEDELMTGYVNMVMYLSKMTAASLDDTGYIVDASKVDAYTLPSRRSNALRSEPVVHVAQDVSIATLIDVLDDNGDVVDHVDGITMQFEEA